VADLSPFSLSSTNGIIIVNIVFFSWKHNRHHFVLGESLEQFRGYFGDSKFKPIFFCEMESNEIIVKFMVMIDAALNNIEGTEIMRKSPYLH